jgi:hypothetical protein
MELLLGLELGMRVAKLHHSITTALVFGFKHGVRILANMA